MMVDLVVFTSDAWTSSLVSFEKIRDAEFHWLCARVCVCVCVCVGVAERL